MRVFREPDRDDWRKQIASATMGALGGLVAGAIASRFLAQRGTGTIREIRSQAMERFRPGPMQRPRADQMELDRLETTVLSEFLMDPRLRERAIDIGAISAGIIELSGVVMSDEEARHAVSLATRIEGVDTVVNRLDIEHGYPTADFRPTSGFDRSSTFGRFEGRVGGMGRTRQGLETEPDRRDDSQAMREIALSAADRDQYADEGLVDVVGDAGASAVNPTRFSEDELDNQDPHGKHTSHVLNSPPEQLNSQARVGDRPGPIGEIAADAGSDSDGRGDRRDI